MVEIRLFRKKRTASELSELKINSGSSSHREWSVWGDIETEKND